jgi:predicted RNase H-like HicB family nuclease
MRRDIHWNIESECEDDGRWIAEIGAVPGVIVYGTTENEAKEKARALAETWFHDNDQEAGCRT